MGFYEFDMVFGGKKESIAVSGNADWDQEVQALFKTVDKNNTGTIDKSELYNTLRLLGLNPTNQKLDFLIKEYAKSLPDKFKYEEFRQIVQDLLRDDILLAEDLMIEIKEKFKKLDVKNVGLLDGKQFK